MFILRYPSLDAFLFKAPESTVWIKNLGVSWLYPEHCKKPTRVEPLESSWVTSSSSQIPQPELIGHGLLCKVYLFIFNSMCMYGCLCACTPQKGLVPAEARRKYPISWNWSHSSCEPPYIHAGNQTPILGKSCKCS